MTKAKAKLEITAETPLTITLLKSIQPGQTLNYYTGHFQEDIARSGGKDSPYGRVLWEVQRAAYVLESQGRVVLSEQEVQRISKHGTVSVIRFSAKQPSAEAQRGNQKDQGEQSNNQEEQVG